jgi:large subunit ribosomal protein L10
MSKYVKNFVTRDIANRLSGVADAVVVNVVGLDGNNTYELRKALRDKGVHVLVVKRTLAARATEGTSLRPAFDDVSGPVAVIWGAEDFVGLAREVTELGKTGKFEKFEIKGGVMDGDALKPDQVKAISKWPSRGEQISLLVGQILGPGRKLASQLIGPGGKLASQIEKIADGDKAESKEEASSEPATA